MTEDYTKLAQDVLGEEARALAKAAETSGLYVAKAAEKIFESTGKLIIIGVGKSGLVGRKAAATFSSTGTPAIFIHPVEALHGDLGVISDGDAVICISYSGESDEIQKIIPHITSRCSTTVAVTASPNSSLAKAADVYLPVAIEKEADIHGIAPTTSTTVTMALLDALAVVLMRMKNFSKEDFARHHPGGSLGKRLFVKISDVMRTEGLPVTNPETSLREAIPIMTNGRLGTLVFLDAKRQVQGILSDGDLRRALSEGDFSLDARAISYATREVQTTRGDLLAVDVLQQMEDHKIQVIPVTEEDHTLKGIVHLHDLVELGFK